MKVKKLFFAALLLCVSLCTYAQTEIGKGKAPVVGLKTNLPYWGTATFNAGLEFRLAKKWSLDIEAGFNPFDGKNDDGTYDRSLKHLRIQPELRYWFCEANNGHFLGLHVPYYLYNVADVKLIGLEDERREGWGAGVGLSYGCSRSTGAWRRPSAYGTSTSNTTAIPAPTAATARRTATKTISVPRRPH